MAKLPLKEQQFLTVEKLLKLLDPGRVFYRVAINDAIKRGDFHEIDSLLKGAREVKTHFGDLDSVISKLEAAAQKAKG